MSLSDHSREKILDILERSPVRLTPAVYADKISRKFHISLGEARGVLKQLVEEQELSYHYIYGSTYIEKNFLKPVCIAEKFIIVPWNMGRGACFESGKTGIKIILESAISFGSGRHPTTGLCLESIKWAFFENQISGFNKTGAGADIGTGSGILAIAMCLSGLESCTAYEIDPVSLNEAEKNIGYNRLEDRIRIVDTPMTEPECNLSCICANLRWPGLKKLADTVHESLEDNGIVILSGIREWEARDLERVYVQKGFEPVWQGQKKQWSGFVFVKHN
jgi:ribosomal protein L11 methyltransferase